MKLFKLAYRSRRC